MIIKFKEYDIVAQPAEVFELMELAAGIKEEVTVKPEVKLEEVAPAKPKQVRGPYKKVLDVGKMKALRKANWTLAQIADEMRCSESTVCKKLKEA